MPSPSRIRDKVFYGWVLVAAFLAIGTISNGSRRTFTVFFKSFESEFSLTRAVTSGVLSVHMVLSSLFSILGGWALDRYGPRTITLLMGLFIGLSLLLTSQANATWQLFITYGFLFSLGSSGIYIVTMATVSRWFDKKRGLALGIASSGAGLGTLLIAPFATYLISSFGWRVAYAVIGLIAWLIIIPSSRLLRKTPDEIGVLPDGVKSSPGETGTEEPRGEDSAQLAGFSLLEASRTNNFWLFGSISLLRSICLFLVLTHIVPHATDIGISAAEAAVILSLMSGSTIASRLLIGRVSDSIGRKKTASACALLVAGAMIWLIWSRDLWMLYLFGIVFGFFYGGLDPSISTLIGDTFGLRSIGVIMGTLNVSWGVGAAIGAAAGGLIFDVSNSYSMAFSGGAVAMLTVALLIALTEREKR